MTPLNMWVVYERPTDHPDHFVVRRWEVDNWRSTATADFSLADDLDGARAKVPPGLACIARHPSDEPQIVEVWL